MSRVCEVCGKGKMKGNLVSHSNIKTNRHYDANLQKVNTEINGQKVNGYVCAKCLKKSKAN